MNSSSFDRISNPGPNLTLPGRLSRVAGTSNRAEAGGFGGSDWPGAAGPPEADGVAAVAGVPTSAPPVPSAPAPVPAGDGPPPAPGGFASSWLASRLTVASSWRIRSSSLASREAALGTSSGGATAGFGVGGEGAVEGPPKGSWDGTCATAGIPTP